MSLPGGFHAEWSIWCAAQLRDDTPASDDCPTWESVEGKRRKSRVKDARAKGWRYHSGIGWLCPPCTEHRRTTP